MENRNRRIYLTHHKDVSTFAIRTSQRTRTPNIEKGHPPLPSQRIIIY